MLSLKCLTIREVICRLPNIELDKLYREIESIKSGRVNLAEKNFNDKVTKLTGIFVEGRDWIIDMPRLEDMDMTIRWYNDGTHNGNNYKYRLLMEFNEKTVKIERFLVCTCFSPLHCNGKCYVYSAEVNCILVTGKIVNNEIEYEINQTLTDKITLEWIPKVMQLYRPLFLNYKDLYDGYFNDLSKIDLNL